MKRLQSVLCILLVCFGLSAHAQDARRPAGLSRAIRDAQTYASTGQFVGEEKVMGGTFAVAGDDPWQVGLVLAGPMDGNRVLFCGGSLISARLVVTAAHCVDEGTPPAALHVIVGATKLPTEGRRIRVARIWIDPDFGKAQWRSHDVALLELVEDVSSLGAPISVVLPGDDAGLVEKSPVRVTGWGAPSQGGGPVRDLRTVDLMLISTERCNDPVVYNGEVGASMLCAGWPDGGRNSCQGDSGGPLTGMVRGERHLIGVVSWGRECELTDKYGVYARLTVMNWIRSCISDLINCKGQ